LEILPLSIRRNRSTTFLKKKIITQGIANEACRKRKPNERLQKLKQEGRQVARERRHAGRQTE
jgi:hypothetical protein